MVTDQDFRADALALPEAQEADHHGFPSFRVGGKIFATHPEPGHVHLMLSPEDIREAVREHPGACSERWWGKTLAAVRVELAAVQPDVLRDLLHAAWERRAHS